jgi:superfamily II DNA/RNA helicase
MHSSNLSNAHQYSLEPIHGKWNALLDIYSQISVYQSIIYCNSKAKMKGLAKKLAKHDFTVSVLSHDLLNQNLNQSLEDFVNGNTRILLTNMQIQILPLPLPSVNLILNYDRPKSRKKYNEHIGGYSGLAITLYRW